MSFWHGLKIAFTEHLQYTEEEDCHKTLWSIRIDEFG